MRFRPNYDLTNLNTLKLHSSAKYFTQLTSVSQLFSLSEFIKAKGCEYMILGSGSNILLPEFYNGLVVHNRLYGVKLLRTDNESVLIKAMAGHNWDTFVELCICSGWYGLENLSRIPGTVGATPVQNIGAYGVEVGSFIDSLEVYNFTTCKIEYLTQKDCKFTYRNSILKNNLHYMVLSVTFKLNIKPNINLSYPEVAKCLSSSSKSRPVDVRNCVSNLRAMKLPDPLIIPNVGSFFHNPIVSVTDAEKLLLIYDKLPVYKIDDKYCKLSAGWLIDNLGLKGYQNNNMMIYDKHALILVNKGNATQLEVLLFASMIQAKVLEKYNVKLNIEPIII